MSVIEFKVAHARLNVVYRHWIELAHRAGKQPLKAHLRLRYQRETQRLAARLH